jgi:glycosyltransferase involved in cell wall biosynthesis
VCANINLGIMKILLSINSTDFGGTETTLFQLATRLRAKGHQVSVLSLKPIGRIGKRLEHQGIEIYSLNMSEEVKIKDFVFGIWKLTRWLRLQRFDLVHSFLPRSNIMSRVSNRFSGSKSAHLSSERAIGLERSKFIVIANRLTARWTDCFIAVSPAVRDVLIQRERISTRKIRVVFNGIDLETLDSSLSKDVRGGLNIVPQRPMICSVGRLHQEKGHIYLIRALAHLCLEWPDLCVVIVGEGAEAERLYREAIRLGVDNNVLFLGYRADAIDIIRASDIFVLPSLEEGLPVTILEAMACSRPIVASDVGGLPSTVISEQTGLLVPPKDVAALSHAIERLLRDQSMREQLGHCGRARVEKLFTLERMLSDLENLYRIAIGNGLLLEEVVESQSAY